MGRRPFGCVSLVALLLFLHASRTMTEDALMEEEEMEMNDSSEETKKIKAKNNKADDDAFHELESPEEEEPLPDVPILITDNNWRQLDKGEWLIEFYAPWCPACRALQPRWDQLARDVKAFKEMRVRIAKCDVTSNPWLTGRMMIASLPTIFHIKEKEYRKYSGSRNVEELYDYLLKKKWEDTPVLEKWREPHGAAMTAMSGFYKLANVVQTVHDTMTIGYGFPAWASYVIFGLVTLACGLTAGLVIVCCMDCLSTPTTPERRAAIVEKNRRAREERERQEKLTEELENRRKEADEEEEKNRAAERESAYYDKEDVKNVKSFLRSEKRSQRRKLLRRRARMIKRGMDVEEIEKNEREENRELRRRFAYRVLDEDEEEDEDEELLSTDEELYADSDEDHVSTETTETEATESEEEEDEEVEEKEEERREEEEQRSEGEGDEVDKEGKKDK